MTSFAIRTPKSEKDPCIISPKGEKTGKGRGICYDDKNTPNCFSLIMLFFLGGQTLAFFSFFCLPGTFVSSLFFLLISWGHGGDSDLGWFGIYV